MALRWRNIDFEGKRIVVSQAVEETKLFGTRLKAPKSGKTRVIPLADNLVSVLRTHKEVQDAERVAIGAFYEENDLVFCNENGSIWPPDTLTKQFGKIRDLVGQKGFRLHDVRHAFASISLRDGTSIKEVSELLGHSTPAITLSTYAHTMQGQAREAVNRVADRFLKTEEAPIAL